MIEGGVAKVEGKPGVLQELAKQLVGVDGLLGQPVVPLVVPGIAGSVRAGRPLQEVLVGDAGHRQHQGQQVEGAQALSFDHLHEGVARKAWRDAALQAEEDAQNQGHQHRQARLLVPPEHLLPSLTFRVGGRLGRANRAEDAHSHDEVQMSKSPAVGELRQRLAVLQRLVDVPAHCQQRHVRDLVLHVSHQLRHLLANHLGHLGICGPVSVLRRHQLAHQKVPVPLHARLLRVLEDLKVLGAVGASLAQQDVIAPRVAAQQRLQIVNPVVDDHVRLLRARVLGHLRASEERQLLARADLRQLGETALLRQRRRVRLARHLHRGLGRFDVSLGGPLQPPQLVVQLLQLLHHRVLLRLPTHLSHLGLRPHEELHPLLAGEPARDLVPHRRGVAARPRQDGVALLWVVHQEVCEVVHAPVDGDPTIVRLVVTRNLRQGDAPAQVL